MALLIVVDKTVGPVTDFHNLVAASVTDDTLYIVSQRASRARFVAQHFTAIGYDVHNLCNADNTIDHQIDRLIPKLQDVDSVIVAGALQASTVVAIAGVLDALLEVDRPIISYEA